LELPVLGRRELLEPLPVSGELVELLPVDPLGELQGECIEDRYLGPELDLDQLLTYPRGSLGYTYAKVMKRLGYAAHFYGDRPSIAEETDFVTMRVRKTHDLHHIVTGFSMTGPGELGVIAITALQYGYPAFMTIDLGAIELSMLRVAGWSDQVRYVRTGWDMAERITPLMGVRWGRRSRQAAGGVAARTQRRANP